MNLYILESYDSEFPIIRSCQIKESDVVNGVTLAKWLNKKIVNLYLSDHDDNYNINDDGLSFKSINDDLLNEFRQTFVTKDKSSIEIYIYGDYGDTYLFMGIIPKG